MVVMVALSSSCFMISSPRHCYDSMASSNLGGIAYASSWGLHARLNAARFGVTDSSMPLISPITTTFRKPSMMLDCKKKSMELVSDLGLGSLVNDGFVFRQNFYIRSYETGPDRKALVETLMNYLQETTLNHVKAIGLFHEGMGSTPEMAKRSLQWAMTKLLVAVDHYPTWGDVVQVDTWNATSGTYGVRCNWMLRDCKTGKIFIRASSIAMMMNKKTRRLSKIPDKVLVELKQVFVDTPFIVEDNTRKWLKQEGDTVDHVRNVIKPRWSDLDANQHVNNVKYIGWILESVPMVIMEKYDLASMSLEYRRECRKDDVLQCHTCVPGKNNDGISDYDHVDCQHLLQLDVGSGGDGDGYGDGDGDGDGDGNEILKGRTKWRLK